MTDEWNPPPRVPDLTEQQLRQVIQGDQVLDQALARVLEGLEHDPDARYAAFGSSP